MKSIANRRILARYQERLKGKTVTLTHIVHRSNPLKIMSLSSRKKSKSMVKQVSSNENILLVNLYIPCVHEIISSIYLIFTKMYMF